MEGNVITVDFGDEVKEYRNCDPDRLLEIVGIGGGMSEHERRRPRRARALARRDVASAS